MVEKDTYSGVKYTIHAKFTINGVVERHDVIGAIFGQTEGLFPKDFELRELQRVGKIGRIDIDLKSANDQTNGILVVPSSLDRPETAVIAASMETVDRVGPCEAKISIEYIRDIRADKLKRIQDRAKELMRDWHVRETHDMERLFEEVHQESKKVEPVHYGRERLTATPDISHLREIIVVEGRADVINLLKAGISGSIAVEGAKIPRTIRDLAKRKEITAFLDGDRGGDLILRELAQVARPKWVARAPRGSEVEELDPNQIVAALDGKVSFEDAMSQLESFREEKPPREAKPREERERPIEEKRETVQRREAPPTPSPYKPLAETLQGTLEAVFIGQEGKEVARFPVSELVDKLKEAQGVLAVVFDGIITGRLIDTAVTRGVKAVIGDRIAEGARTPQGLEISAFKDLR